MIRSKALFSVAVYGMLQYYGVVSMPDLLVLCNQCDLCALDDYKNLRQQIEENLLSEQKVFFYKKLVCRQGVLNPKLIWDAQKGMLSGGFKQFALEEYLVAGESDILRDCSIEEIKFFFQKKEVQDEKKIDIEIVRLWLELNNLAELIPLTTECEKNVALFEPNVSIPYMELLSQLQQLSNTMPRWVCKGYSYAELCKEK